ncbi:Nitroreductase family protein [anaerobic digester metagenome]|jgi:nitroreductase/Pyruvate/2-oxoacid:ferredoxin oxidoreductase delta subunit
MGYRMGTILVDPDLCTRCGTCTVVCPSSIIDAADEDALPGVPEGKAGMCIACGHCEAFCPAGALLLNVGPEEKVSIPTGAGTLSPGDLGVYLQKRRSVRRYTGEPVPRETILAVLDIVRYAPSGGNGQPVEWIVVHDPQGVRTVAALTVDWMKILAESRHPMSGYVPGLIRAWEAGNDVICRGAPHLLVAHIPEGSPVASADAIIALAHFDVAAPAFGIGTCWAGFVSMAAAAYEPLQRELGILAGRKFAYAMLFGNPQHTVHGIPRRNPVRVTWR